MTTPTKLKTRMSPIISVQSLTIGAAAESIATSGGTVPANCGEIHLYPAALLHWSPPGGLTPTSTTGHAVAVNEVFVLSPSQHTSLIIDDTASDQTILAVYMHGSSRQDIRT